MIDMPVIALFSQAIMMLNDAAVIILDKPWPKNLNLKKRLKIKAMLR